MIPKIKKVKFKYIYADDYNPLYVNGVHGGRTSKGEIEMNFFLERSPLPRTMTHNVLEDGKLEDSSIQEPNDGEDTLAVVRYMEQGIILNLGTAVAIRKWLDTQIKELTPHEQEEKK